MDNKKPDEPAPVKPKVTLAKGKCKIYVVATNGVKTTVSVTVK